MARLLWEDRERPLPKSEFYHSLSLRNVAEHAVLDSFDVEFPREFADDESWKTADLGKHSILSFWIHYLKLTDIIGFAHRALVS